MNPANYLKIKNKIPSNVNILAVSKGFKSQEIKTIQNIGQNDFGESKFQEAFEKQLILKDLKQINWHFIGSIQSRKVESIYKNCEVIHSIDRMKIVKLFAALERSEGLKRKYFIQINTGNEPQKSGVLFNEAEQFIIDCLSNYKLEIIGLMCLPPIDEDPKIHFQKLRDLGKKFYLNSLSMGMSADYQVALECGSTHIRIGTQIFGERN